MENIQQELNETKVQYHKMLDAVSRGDDILSEYTKSTIIALRTKITYLKNKLEILGA